MSGETDADASAAATLKPPEGLAGWDSIARRTASRGVLAWAHPALPTRRSSESFG